MAETDVLEHICHRKLGCADRSGVAEARAVTALESGQVIFLPNLAFALEPDETRSLYAGCGRQHAQEHQLRPGDGTLRRRRARRRRRHAAGGDARPLRTALDRCCGTCCRAMRRSWNARAQASARWKWSSAHNPCATTTAGSTSMRSRRGRCADGASCACSATWRRTALRGSGTWASRSMPSPRKFLPRLSPPIPGSAWVLDALGMTKGRRSAYDRIMLGLHDTGKRDDQYQREAPPGSDISARQHLDRLHRSGIARGAGGTLRLRADVSPADRRNDHA